MRHVDLSPLYRSTVGFDRLFNLVDSVAGRDAEVGYPPYNIEATGDNSYRISIAIAGFTREDLNIEVKENLLRVRGKKADDASDAKILHRGIAERAFERRFQLADYVEVTGR